jgi:gamma-glutamyltranspeptidase/glutathione hydrolase
MDARIGDRGQPANRGPGSRAAASLAIGALVVLPGCGTLESLGTAIAGRPAITAGQEGFVRGFLGYVVADEPRAAAVGRTILSTGGTAADAAAATGLMMAVTLPSRAGLGGGGVCLIYDPRRNLAEAVIFPPGAREAVPEGADRPAALPMMARGLFALHARGGRRPFEELVSPAEQAARFGFEASRVFAADIAAVSGPLFADPWAAAAFGGTTGRPPGVGDRVVQPDLGSTLSILRTAGVGDMYQGGLARRLEEASRPAGGGLTSGELRAAIPRVVPPLQQRVGVDLASFVPAEGGQATVAAFETLMGGGAPPLPGPGNFPASASLVVVDRDGMAVSCAFTMNNLFGTGRVVPGTGLLLAAAPGIGQIVPPPLAVGLVHNANQRVFRAASAGSGQAMAPLAAAIPLAAMMRGQDAAGSLTGIPEPGRGVAINCPRYLPGPVETCTAAADARGGGLALGGVDR